MRPHRRWNRRILDLGGGYNPKWAVRKSLEEPGTEVIVVDREKESNYKHVLRQMKPDQRIIEVPGNLRVLTDTDAVDYLKSEGDRSFDEVHASFMSQHLPHDRRRILFQEVHRVLKHGAEFTAFEDARYRRQLPKELRQHSGLNVSVRRITPDELRKLGTEYAGRKATAILGFNLLFKRGLPPEAIHGTIEFLFGPQSPIIKAYGMTAAELARAKPKSSSKPEDLREAVIALFRKGHEADWRKVEGERPSREARGALRVTLSDIEHILTDNPYIVCTARKPEATRRVLIPPPPK